MSNAYTSLAAVYDSLMDGVDYAEWVDSIEARFGKYASRKPLSVLDLACGTGSVTVELARRGYDMTGIDLSEDMLAAAQAKCEAERFAHKVLLIRQDMAELELYGTVEAAVCCLDSLNYLPSVDALRRTFMRVHNYLEPDGLFLFDMNTPTKFREVYGFNTYVLEDDGIFCTWQNLYNDKTRFCDFYLTIFREGKDGRWERWDEVQRERCYSLRTVKKLLDECGFELCELAGDLSGNPPAEDCERWYFTARAKKIPKGQN